MSVSISESVETIRCLHRNRFFAMEQRKRVDLSLGAFLRSVQGYHTTLPAAERAPMEKRARDAITIGERVFRARADADTAVTGADPFYHEWADVIAASVAARAPFAEIEDRARKEIESLVRGLPVWEGWAAGIKGIGQASVGVVIGEAGDLSAYDDYPKLWKRMGLAVLDGRRQGAPEKGCDADEWVRHGYSPRRRSRMWTIGDSLVKCAGGPYRDIYLRRKAYERERAESEGLTVLPAARIPKKDADQYMSDGHVHRRAQRYMEKKLLRDLWRAWRRTNSVASHDEVRMTPSDVVIAEAA